MPKQIYMESQSFRDILHQLLEQDSEGKPDNSPLETPRNAEFAPLFDWKAPEFRAKPRNAYTTPSSRKNQPPPGQKRAPAREEKPPRRPESEKILSMKELKASDQTHVLTMIQLGSEELKTGVSIQRVKKAHRRLVKKLHPDAGGQRELFQLLQSAYEALSRSLPPYISVSDCGNESASESESLRRDAA